MFVLAGWIAPCALGAAPEGTPDSISDILRQPWSRHFWIERTGGQFRLGDPASGFGSCDDLTNLTFDIGNNVMLANVGAQGELKAVTSYRDTYKTVTSSWPGVWTCKDTSTYGPYSFTLEWEEHTNDLATVDWDFRSGLLDNLFPITEFTGPGKRFTARLVTYAPVSTDGSQRLRGVVYGLQLENTSLAPLAATVVLPKCSSGKTPYHQWSQSDEFGAFDYGLGDAPAFAERIAVSLKAGETRWVPLVICALDEGVVRAVNTRGTAAWLRESQGYYRSLLGRLRTPAQPFVAEFYERAVMQALQALGESGQGRIAGANWGSVPPTRMIWTKDMYYASLPLMTLDPDLAAKLIRWFNDYGVRPEGVVLRGDQRRYPTPGEFAGGVNHSLSLSVAAPLLAGIYYDRTGDAALFREHPQWKSEWMRLMDKVLASRCDPEVWLFPTRFISDGPVSGDFHTGSNVCVWRALVALARLLAEPWNDPKGARRYATAAENVRAAVLDKCVIDGPFGKQFIEATWRDGRSPKMESDGEESDTTLMPFYGFLAQDDPAYVNYMRFSLSTNNVKYTPALNCLAWEESVPSTAPGYNKGLCAGINRESLFGERGFFTTLRAVTDADGSVWWWSYGDAKHLQLQRAYWGIGKSGWAAGVTATVIPSRFIGARYDASRREFRFAPMAALGDFAWANFPQGKERFSVSFKSVPDGLVATLANPNPHPLRLEATLPAEGLREPWRVTANGRPVTGVKIVEYMSRKAALITLPVGARETLELDLIASRQQAALDR